MLLLIDNYDSFTYNLQHYFLELGVQVAIHRHDALTIADIQHNQPQWIVISPGPGTPAQAGISLDVIHHFAGKIPILGVCLGHQCIAQALGGQVQRAAKIMHGKTSSITHEGQGLFAGLPQMLSVTRYHSLLVDKHTLPDCLRCSAQTADGEIMGLAHTTWPLVGVQFHPEAVLTQAGHRLLENFLSMSV